MQLKRFRLLTCFALVFMMLALTYLAEAWSELTLTALIGQIWLLPFLIYLNVVNTTEVNKWVFWVVVTLLLAYPNGELITMQEFRSYQVSPLTNQCSPSDSSSMELAQ